MPIDFSQVITITIPEGEVISISDSNGNIIWSKSGGTLGLSENLSDSKTINKD